MRKYCGLIGHKDPSLKLIVAPHEITKHHISKLITQFPGAVLYSDFKTSGFWSQKSSILIIDNIGMLSRLYKYAYITYVGGGFGKGIHNTLEAAVFGKPVLFGPSYRKFNEAIELVANGGAVSINNSRECMTIIQKFLQDEIEYISSCQNSKEYVYANRGATQKIMQYIQENRLLTN
jgi:3-deoxy-D-manno-octulosonic-acid transferase